MKKILDSIGLNWRIQLGAAFKKLAKRVLKLRPEWTNPTNVIRQLVAKGYQAEFGEPCPADVLALIESEQKG